jgi:carbonic anhydrase
MSAIDDAIAANERFAAETPPADAAAKPSRGLVVVTCMDARIDVLAALGLNSGEAHVLRNAGGVVSDDVIRSLAISQRKLGTREVMLIHHTNCGMETISDEGFNTELQEETGLAPDFPIESFADAEGDVRASIQKVRHSPFLPHRDEVRGFVYDVGDGRLREIHLDG